MLEAFVLSQNGANIRKNIFLGLRKKMAKSKSTFKVLKDLQGLIFKLTLH